jgi:hypothetical protein
MYCNMHAVGQQSTVETTSVFYGVWPQPAHNSRGNCCSLCGLFTGYIAGQLRGQSVSEWWQGTPLELVAAVVAESDPKSSEEEKTVSWQLSRELQFQLRVSIRAEQQSSEKSCSCNSELRSVYTVIGCNCVWSNKSSCQSNTCLI